MRTGGREGHITKLHNYKTLAKHSLLQHIIFQPLNCRRYLKHPVKEAAQVSPGLVCFSNYSAVMKCSSLHPSTMELTTAKCNINDKIVLVLQTTATFLSYAHTCRHSGTCIIRPVTCLIRPVNCVLYITPDSVALGRWLYCRGTMQCVGVVCGSGRLAGIGRRLPYTGNTIFGRSF